MRFDPIIPDWPVPTNVRALMTTRGGGVSIGPYASLNLGAHVDDDAGAVLENRRRLAAQCGAAPVWLNQIHGTTVVDLSDLTDLDETPTADAAISRHAGRACAIMTADCLPVLFCDRAGSVVGAAHAGWRGLCSGVLEETVARMGVAPASVIAWLGAAIGPDAFEVGDQVREAFMAHDRQAAAAFVPAPGNGKWRADIYRLARQRLANCGVSAVFGGGACTVAEEGRFFSYRRDGVTGRMAALVWLERAG